MIDVRVLAVAVTVLVLGACTPPSRPTAPGPRTEETLRTDGSFTMSMQLNRSDAFFRDTVALDAGRAWTELPAVYGALGLPVNELVSAERRIGVVAHQPRRIEGQALSRFLDCGRGPTGGEYADTYQVYLWVETRLVASPSDPSSVTVQSKLTANARPRAVSGNPVPCKSLGRLERRINELVRARLVPAGG
jgi:hypothetical protein